MLLETSISKTAIVVLRVVDLPGTMSCCFLLFVPCLRQCLDMVSLSDAFVCGSFGVETVYAFVAVTSITRIIPCSANSLQTRFRLVSLCTDKIRTLCYPLL